MSKRRLRLWKHEPFICKLERGRQEHDFAFVERNMPKLEGIIREIMQYQATRPAMACARSGGARQGIGARV